MLTEQNEAVIQRVVSQLVAAYAPQQVILFGSYAYGVPDRDSDIDLLIIKDTEEPFLKRMVSVSEATDGAHKGIPCDAFVLTPDELQGRVRKGDQFIMDILERGRVLYAQ